MTFEVDFQKGRFRSDEHSSLLSLMLDHLDKGHEKALVIAFATVDLNDFGLMKKMLLKDLLASSGRSLLQSKDNAAFRSMEDWALSEALKPAAGIRHYKIGHDHSFPPGRGSFVRLVTHSRVRYPSVNMLDEDSNIFAVLSIQEFVAFITFFRERVVKMMVPNSTSGLNQQRKILKDLYDIVQNATGLMGLLTALDSSIRGQDKRFRSAYDHLVVVAYEAWPGRRAAQKPVGKSASERIGKGWHGDIVGHSRARLAGMERPRVCAKCGALLGAADFIRQGSRQYACSVCGYNSEFPGFVYNLALNKWERS